MATLVVSSGQTVQNFFDPERTTYSLGVDALYDRTSIQGQGSRINDLQVQVATNGHFIPIIYNRYRVAGNVIWANKPVQNDQMYIVSIAVAICEGPGIDVLRIWADGKLYYDASGNNSGVTSLFKASSIALYRGDEAQNPDPTIEADVGAGLAPAHRGLCYMVFKDLQLDKFGNKIPNLTFEVATETVYDLSGIVTDITKRLRVNTQLRVNSLQLTDAVTGYGITSDTTGREAVEGLMPFFFFDCVESDGQLKFVKRGGPVVQVLSSADTILVQG